VSWSVTDDESAISSTSGCGTVVLTSETDGTTLTCTATSEGGTASSSVTIKIDKTAPEVTIATPEDDGSYTFNQTILADWSASDTLSGIDTATGTVPSGDPIDTNSLGTKSFTVTATDFAGNSTTVTVDYEVVPYDFGGFGAPLTISMKDFKKMSTIPVKFQLFDTFGNPVSNAIATLMVNSEPAVSSGGSNVGNCFRYDPVKQQYIFNLSTKTLSLGSNKLKVTLDDGTEYSQTITIK
jgi:hypothetical protein